MAYDFKKSLVVAGLITVGSDGAVTDHELKLLDSYLLDNHVTMEEEQKILKEVTPRLGSAVAKGALLREVTKYLNTNEKKKILQSCCTLMFSDMHVKEDEVKTLKKIGAIMSVPDSITLNIINTELAKHE